MSAPIIYGHYTINPLDTQKTGIYTDTHRNIDRINPMEHETALLDALSTLETVDEMSCIEIARQYGVNVDDLIEAWTSEDE